jgi:hypothetical protein
LVILWFLNPVWEPEDYLTIFSWQRSPTITDDYEAGQSNSRLFVLLAIALVGLICVGLLGLSVVLLANRANRQQEAAVATEFPTIAPPTFTPTSTPTATPTETPLPTPTGTRVVGPTNTPTPGGDRSLPTSTPDPNAPTVDPNATPTSTLVVQPTTAVGTPAADAGAAQVVPDSGGVLPVSRGILLWIGAGLLLVLLLYGSHSHSKPS